MATAGYNLRDAKAANLRAQARSQKLELDALIKRSLAAASTTRSAAQPGRGGRGGAAQHHQRASKLLNADIEFNRKNLRNTYLTLLFTFTFNRLAHGVDNLLWTDTTYCLISAFRTLISTQQKALAAATAAPTTGNARAKLANDVARTQTELRKLLHDDESFWRELAASIVRIFTLDEARANLEALGIACDSDGDTTVGTPSQASDTLASSLGRHQPPSEALSQAALLPANRTHLLEAVQKALIFCGDLARYRELHCPQPSDAAPSVLETEDRGPPHRGARGGARGGRPAHAHANVATATGPHKAAAPADDAATYKQDFGRALAFYEQARLLLPDNGNPSNQLAVIATYNADPLLSIYHCYRALCVRLPFEKAKINLDKTLAKPIEAWLESGGMDDARSWDDSDERRMRSSGTVERLSTNLPDSEAAFRKWIGDVVVLHGLFFQRVHLDCIMPLSHSVLAQFSSLVRARAVPADLVVRVVVTGLCASWTTRLWRNTPSSFSSSNGQRARGNAARSRSGTIRSSGKGSSVDLDPASRLCIEHQILAHVLGVFRELAEVVVDETQQAIQSNRQNPPSAPAGGAAGSAAVRHLTAVVRRTLPALRVATKWMKTHLEYIQRSGERAAASSQASDVSLLQPSLNPTLEAIPNEEELREAQVRVRADADAAEAIEGFWRSYVAMINVLRYAFPFETLPNIGKAGPVGAPALCLEEDSDMRGLTPTKKAMQLTAPGIGGGSVVVNLGMGEACSHANAVRPSQVHPNEEQLMRVADLLIDAKVVAESDASPIRYEDGQNIFVFDGETSAAGASQTRAAPSQLEARASPARVSPSSTGAAKPDADRGERNERQDEASSEGFSEMTDDPVELAMRAVDGRRTGESSLMDGMEESMRDVRVDDDQHRDEESRERILVPSQIRYDSRTNDDEAARLFAQATNASGGQERPAAPGAYPDPRASGSDTPKTAATAQDLLLQMLQGRVSGPAGPPPSQVLSAQARSSVAGGVQPQLLFGGVSGPNGSPDGHGGRSIWSSGPSDARVGSPPSGGASFGSALPPPAPAPFGWGQMAAGSPAPQHLARDPSAQGAFAGHRTMATSSHPFGVGAGTDVGLGQPSGLRGDMASAHYAEQHFGSPYGQVHAQYYGGAAFVDAMHSADGGAPLGQARPASGADPRLFHGHMHSSFGSGSQSPFDPHHPR